ncbi:MAG TPA: endonuclease domain-containing protein [Burkholderiales bacterium]|nr:endonuclease domain-containing protein [Burkholderiales bacterium]
MASRRFIPYRAISTSRARELRRNATAAERKLWHEFLRNLPEKFTRQKPLGAYIVDFYCSGSRLAIEIDGDSHFDDAAERYDERRTAALSQLGVRVVRFTNEGVFQNFEAVCEMIVAALREGS